MGFEGVHVVSGLKAVRWDRKRTLTILRIAEITPLIL